MRQELSALRKRSAALEAELIHLKSCAAVTNDHDDGCDGTCNEQQAKRHEATNAENKSRSAVDVQDTTTSWFLLEAIIESSSTPVTRGCSLGKGRLTRETINWVCNKLFVVMPNHQRTNGDQLDTFELKDARRASHIVAGSFRPLRG